MSLPGSVMVDDDIRGWAEQHAWWLHSANPTHPRYVRGYIDRRFVYLHRAVTGAKNGQSVDHINGNTLDNRRVNLRVVSHAENLQNRIRLQRNNTSGYRGVVWDASRQKWQARAKLKGKGVLLGRFSSKDEAREVVVQWRRKNMPFSEELTP